MERIFKNKEAKFRFALGIYFIVNLTLWHVHLNSIFMAFSIKFGRFFVLNNNNFLYIHNFVPEILKRKLKIIIYQLRMTSYPVKEMQIQHCQFGGNDVG